VPASFSRARTAPAVCLKLRPARACPWRLVSFPSPPPLCRLPYLAHFPRQTSLASRHPHEHRTASSLSLVLCNLTFISLFSQGQPSLFPAPTAYHTILCPRRPRYTDASTTVPFYHRLLLVSSHTTLPSTFPPGCRTPVLDTAFISSLPTTTSPSSRLSLGPNYRCLAHP
jgi:hypothetical protein